jgi:hypothetical protein
MSRATRTARKKRLLSQGQKAKIAPKPIRQSPYRSWPFAEEVQELHQLGYVGSMLKCG